MMGKDSTRHRCRWVCDRLPLLDGGELTGSDRRKVESHLVFCQICRANHAGLADALNVLRAAAAEPPTVANARAIADAPSLWPAIQRQIRESRHQPRQHSAFAEAALWFDRSSSRLAGLAAAGLVAIVLTSAGVGFWVRAQLSSTNAFVEAASHPIPRHPAPRHSALDFGPSVVRNETESPARIDRISPSRFGYDLDHGTPMSNPNADQIKPSY